MIQFSKTTLGVLLAVSGFSIGAYASDIRQIVDVVSQKSTVIEASSPVKAAEAAVEEFNKELARSGYTLIPMASGGGGGELADHFKVQVKSYGNRYLLTIRGAPNTGGMSLEEGFGRKVNGKKLSRKDVEIYLRTQKRQEIILIARFTKDSDTINVSGVSKTFIDVSVVDPENARGLFRSTEYSKFGTDVAQLGVEDTRRIAQLALGWLKPGDELERKLLEQLKTSQNIIVE